MFLEMIVESGRSNRTRKNIEILKKFRIDLETNKITWTFITCLKITISNLLQEKDLKLSRDKALEFLDSISRNLDTNSE
jgi:hypothetical protein